MRDKRAKKMVIQLLSKVPELRLGGSYAALKAHTWFDDFDWDKLYNKELKPPFLPQAGNIEADIKQARTNAVPVIDEIEKE
jgi:cGMP-dependent protein kinase